MKTLTVIAATLILLTGSLFAGIERVDISPAMLINLGQGHSGSMMGAAVTGDIFFSRAFAVRTTVGFTKDRYFPKDRDYGESDYGFWLSFAPYAELNLGNSVRPYVSFLGSFSTGSGGRAARTPIGMNDAPVSRLSTAPSSANSYSFGGSIGSKVQLTGPISLFGEITHYFYSSISNSATFDSPGIPEVTFNYEWDRTPTFISLGLTYSLPFDNNK